MWFGFKCSESPNEASDMVDWVSKCVASSICWSNSRSAMCAEDIDVGLFLEVREAIEGAGIRKVGGLFRGKIAVATADTKEIVDV